LKITAKHIVNKLVAVKVLMFMLVCLFIACGPRSGIHSEEEEEEGVCGNETKGICGNSFQNTVNNNWVKSAYGLAGNPAHGAKLFKQNCAVCHSLTDQKLTGSGLRGIIDRVPKPEIEWLRKYILNNEKVLKSGDAYAKKLKAQSGETSMTVFEGQLTNEELNDLLMYVLSNTR
jgi:mono/diheme cytochrome c family protein